MFVGPWCISGGGGGGAVDCSHEATAVEYDNLILVASGIGITPAMSIITTYKETRVNACERA